MQKQMKPSMPHSCVICINCHTHVTHVGILNHYNYRSVATLSAEESELPK